MQGVNWIAGLIRGLELPEQGQVFVQNLEAWGWTQILQELYSTVCRQIDQRSGQFVENPPWLQIVPYKINDWLKNLEQNQEWMWQNQSDV